jgi:hypothetical protein
MAGCLTQYHCPIFVIASRPMDVVKRQLASASDVRARSRPGDFKTIRMVSWIQNAGCQCPAADAKRAGDDLIP